MTRNTFLPLLALLVFCALSWHSHAAPVPPPPKQLTAEMMVGKWSYSWHNWPDGTIWLHEDKTYSAHHTPGGNYIYHGTWSVEGGKLTLEEWAFDTQWSTNSGPMTYVFEFAAKDYPTLVGTSNGGPKVVLSNLKRE